MSNNNLSKTTDIPLYPVLMVNFIGMLGYSIIMPFLVFLVNRFGGNEFIYGLVGSIYPAFQFFGAPILGRLSDRYGRKKILMISQAGTLIAWMIFIVALIVPVESITSVESGAVGSFIITLPLLLLVFARALDGLTGGNISVANAYLSDISNDENRKANFGKMAMSASLGFIIGPALAGILGATVYQELLPVAGAALISVIALYFIWFHLPESKARLVDPDMKRPRIRKIFAVENKECYKMKNCQDTTWKAVFNLPNIPFMLLLYFLVFLAFSLFFAAFPMHALKTLGWNSFQLGLFFSILSGLMIMVQGPLLTLLSKHYSDQSLVLIGSFFLVAAFTLLVSNNTLIIYSSAALYALGNGLMWPSYLSILSKFGGDRQQGSVQGVANSAGSFASIIGLICGGFLYGLIGSVTFVMAAFILFVIFLLSFNLIRIGKVTLENTQNPE